MLKHLRWTSGHTLTSVMLGLRSEVNDLDHSATEAPWSMVIKLINSVKLES